MARTARTRTHAISDRTYRLGIVGGYLVETDPDGYPVERPDYLDLAEWLAIRSHRAESVAVVHATSLARAIDAARSGLIIAGGL